MLSHLRSVKDTVTMQTEDMRIVGPVDEVHQVLADVVCELLKDRFGLFLSERSHVVLGKRRSRGKY